MNKSTWEMQYGKKESHCWVHEMQVAGAQTTQVYKEQVLVSESTNSCRGVLRVAVGAQTGSLMESGMWGEIHLWDDTLP